MKRLSKTQTLVTLALCSALLVIAQVSLAVIPNVELVSLLCIVYTLFFRKKALAIIYVFVMVEGVIFGFGIWWFNYLYIWTILWAVTMLAKNLNSSFAWAIISAFYGLFFGMLTAIPYFFMGGLPTAFSYWVSGLVFDIAHCIGNFVVALVLFKPLCFAFSKIYGSPWGKTKPQNPRT